MKTFTFDPLPTERIPFTVVTSAPLAPKVTEPVPLKVRLLKVVLPLIAWVTPSKLTVPAASEKPADPL